MYTYSNGEKTDMILVYGECLKNASLATRVYAQRYPERRAPSDTIFGSLENQLRANWPPVKLSKQRVATGEEHELEIIEILEEEPLTDLLRFYVLFVIKTSFPLVFHLFESFMILMSKLPNF